MADVRIGCHPGIRFARSTQNQCRNPSSVLIPSMTHKTDKYAQFADHPRYGRRPNVTRLNPSPMDRNVHLHWNATTPREIAAQYKAVVGKEWSLGDADCYAERSKRIPNTAIPADLSKQTPATVPVTHYFDLERQCRDCQRWFIFYAEEQKHWYEQLGFGLDADCVRCVDCRKQQQGIARYRQTYETLFQIPDKTDEQFLEMADACLCLIEHDVFSSRQTERVRMLLNRIDERTVSREQPRYARLVDRLNAIERRPR